MSVAEIQTELKKLTPTELAQVEAFVKDIKGASVGNGARSTVAEYWNLLQGTVILKPGWEQDEALEMWETLRDNPST